MPGKTFSHLFWVLSTMFVLQSRLHILVFPCGIKPPDKLIEQEGSFKNVTYLLESAETRNFKKIVLVYSICQDERFATRCIFTWTAEVNDVIVENFGSGNQTSCFYERLQLRQSMLTWKLTISQLVDRSLSIMSIYDEKFSGYEKISQTILWLHVEAQYRSRITSLTVDGHEAGSTYLVDKGQKVNITCFYDKGNPPETFRLLDEHGNKLADSENSLTYSLSVQCEDDWPTVLCEGYWSEKNRKVSFLPKCPPQFVDDSVKIVTAHELENITLLVKAHSTEVSECFLISLSSENSPRQNVNCRLSGDPPMLVLALHFNNVKIAQGNWTLTLGNEIGSTNTTISILPDDSVLFIVMPKTDRLHDQASFTIIYRREASSKLSEHICEEVKK